MQRPEVPKQVIPQEATEDDEGEDLEGHPSDGEIDADLPLAGGGGGDSAAGALEDERDEVAGEEDPVEEDGFEAGEGGGEVVDSGGGTGLAPRRQKFSTTPGLTVKNKALQKDKAVTFGCTREGTGDEQWTGTYDMDSVM